MNDTASTSKDMCTASSPLGPSAWDQLTASQNQNDSGVLNSSSIVTPTVPTTPVKTAASPDTSVAHTPQGPPTITHGAVYGEELTAELVNQGWRKFWSKRENRPYYWNKLTGESLWEMPGLQNRPFDPLTDPLGICNPGQPAPGPNGPSTPVHGNLKRRPSEDAANLQCQGGAVPQKKFILSGPWDLEIFTNAVIVERPPTLLPHPHPEIEAMRAAMTMKLVRTYEDLCMRRESIKAPKDSFNRWLMERKNH